MLKNSLLLLLLAIVLIVLSYYYIDRSVVWFLVAHNARQFGVLKLFANNINEIIGAIIFIFYIVFAVKLSLSCLSLFDKKFIAVCNAVVIAVFLKSILKGLFGRYWPATFVCDNPSLVNNRIYGFNWFHSGATSGSFPSGHTTLIFAFSVSMWFLFPKLRWLCVLLALLVVTGQIGMYYHFVSDVIAGITLGSFVAYYNYRYSLTRQLLC